MILSLIKTGQMKPEVPGPGCVHNAWVIPGEFI